MGPELLSVLMSANHLCGLSSAASTISFGLKKCVPRKPDILHWHCARIIDNPKGKPASQPSQRSANGQVKCLIYLYTLASMNILDENGLQLDWPGDSMQANQRTDRLHTSST